MTFQTFGSKADRDTLAAFKAAAALRRITLWEAFTEAMRLWIETPEPVREENFSSRNAISQKNS